MTNLIAAELIESHPTADEVELVLTVSTKSTVGAAGGDFGHRNLTAIKRHRTTVVPLPEPFGERRCLGFAERDGGWLGASAGGRTVRSYVCFAERAAERAILLANRLGMISRIPRAALGSPRSAQGREASSEPIAHWIAVLECGRRIAARTLRCAGDYQCAAASTVLVAEALSGAGLDSPPAAGVFSLEELIRLERLAPALADVGIRVVDEPLRGDAPNARRQGSKARAAEQTPALR